MRVPCLGIAALALVTGASAPAVREVRMTLLVPPVPPRTTIQAHSHRDDRMATVVSGHWQFGYGTHFEEQALKALPAGSGAWKDNPAGRHRI